MATSARNDSSAGSTFALALLLLAFVLLAPGVVLTYAVDQAFGIGCDDRGQLLTFGGAVSAGLLLALAMYARSFIVALAWYVWIGIGTTGLVALARWGLHAEWPVALWSILAK